MILVLLSISTSAGEKNLDWKLIYSFPTSKSNTDNFLKTLPTQKSLKLKLLITVINQNQAEA